MSQPRSCMGGWCAVRERCASYGAPGYAIERRCQPGQHDAYKPKVHPVIRIKAAA